MSQETLDLSQETLDSDDPAFSAMTDGVVYCFETFYRGELQAAQQTEPQQTFTVLLQLSQAETKLALQKRTATTCGGGPWIIDDAAAAHYER